MKMLAVVLLVAVSLFHAACGIGAPPECHNAVLSQTTSSDDFFLDIFVPSNSFRKATTYSGTFKTNQPINGVIVQVRPVKSIGEPFGSFAQPNGDDTLEVAECFKAKDTAVGTSLQQGRYRFSWTSEAYTLGDIQFWYAVQNEVGHNYTWMSGPMYRAHTDTDVHEEPDQGETTTHTVYYIVVPCVLFVIMTIMVVGGIMTYYKVKTGTFFCCCSDWGTPIAYRYARRYRVNYQRRARSDPESAELPPSYDLTVEEENQRARQNVARFEGRTQGEEEDPSVATSDRALLTGP